MEEFNQAGLGWYVKSAHLDYKRSLVMGDQMVVRTWVDEINGSDVKVRFEIFRRAGERLKVACDGWFDYALINLATGRAEAIPDWIFAKYSV